MAVVDPYSSCPCGSGQKFKWCCQKVEAYVEKAQRLFEGGQTDAALAAIEEGLKKAPGNPWLSVRKALYLIRKDRMDQAEPVLQALATAHPDHVGAQGLLVRVVLQQQGPQAAAEQLQKALAACEPERRVALSPAVQMVGLILSRIGHVPSARKHIELAIELAGGEDEVDPQIVTALRALDANPAYPIWLRQDYELLPPPEDLADTPRGSFEQAMGWSGEGLWAQAAATYQLLAVEGLPEAERNLGLCRLWMADDPGAVDALLRYTASVGATPDAVDIEALCQIIAPPPKAGLVSQVHLIWTLRDRDLLLNALRASDRTIFEGTEPLDPDDPEQSFEVDVFAVLDRAKPTGELPKDPRQLPHVRGRVLIARELVMIEGYDDGRMEALTNWMVDLAGPAIPPAHPKTKEIGKALRSSVAMLLDAWVPEETPREQIETLYRQERARLVTEVWPQTPMAYLGGRTPLQAARDGDAEVPLRAAVCQFELTHEYHRDPIDFPALRQRLNIPDEPPIDPETVNIEYLHLTRLHRVPCARLDDDRLLMMYLRAHDYVLPLAMERSATEIASRPAMLDREDVGRVEIFADLANLAMSRLDRAEAISTLERGRASDPAGRTTNALRWEMAEVRLQARSEKPETWVPNLAIILDRYRDDAAANQIILSNLVSMGLIQLARHPDNPEELLLDSRPLQAIMEQYGPKIRTASGTLGVSATKGGIWTPGATPAGSTTSGGIWTPGSPTSSGGEGKKLILPG